MASGRRIVVIANRPPQWLGSPQLERLRGLGDLTFYDDVPGDLGEQIERARDAEVVITPVIVRWTDDAFAALPNLRLICLVAIGTDSIDLAAARRRGVLVANVPGRTAGVVAEHALALMLSVARRTAEETAAIRQGEWRQGRNVFLRGKTLGVVGAGHSGTQMARLGRAVGMDVIAWTFNPSLERAQELGVRFVELDELLAAADVVSLHVRLSDATRHLIGERELELMKRDAVLVNVARGGVVDTDALVRALEAGRLMGAGLDVFEQEPLPSGHPLLRFENVVATPHAADNTPEGMEFLNEGAVDNVGAYLSGAPTNLV